MVGSGIHTWFVPDLLESIRIVDAPREAEYLEAGATVGGDLAPLVDVESLCYGAGCAIHEQSRRAEVVRDHSIRSASLDRHTTKIARLGKGDEG
jgi:hypothetical protein